MYDESSAEPLHYYLSDVQFSTVAIIDKSANVVEWVSYDAYGESQHHRLADLDGSGVVDGADLSNLLTNWGACPGCAADLDRDGSVGASDQSIVLSSYGGASKGKLTEIAAGGGAGAGGNIFGYANYVFNSEVISGGGGMYTVRFRHYDVAVGPWLERDPAGYVDGMNLYEMVASEPLTGVDAFGLASKQPPSTPIFSPSYGLRMSFIGPGHAMYAQIKAMMDFWDSHITPIDMQGPGFWRMTWAYTSGFFIGLGESLTDPHVIIHAVAAASLLIPGWGPLIFIVIEGAHAAWYKYNGQDEDAALTLLMMPLQGIGGRIRMFTGGCFVAATVVLTDCGPSPIESIEAGDCVWSYDLQSSEWELCEVEATQVRDYVGHMVTLRIELGDGGYEEVTCTGSHPFWVTEGEQLAERPICVELPASNSAMTPSGRWTEARWLRLGDKFLTCTGASATVVGLTIRPRNLERVKVYNLHVRDLQLYAVGSAGVLVHNSIPLPVKPILRPGFQPGAGPRPAVLRDGKIYVDRFHATAEELAGGADRVGWVTLDEAGNIVKCSWYTD